MHKPVHFSVQGMGIRCALLGFHGLIEQEAVLPTLLLWLSPSFSLSRVELFASRNYHHSPTQRQRFLPTIIIDGTNLMTRVP